MRLPPLFLAREYSTIPDRLSTPLNHYTYGLDLSLANCYDTAKGVRGVQGLLADKERKKKGVPMWVVLLLVISVLTILGKVIYSIPHHIFGVKQTPVAARSAESFPVASVSAVPVNHSVENSPPAGGPDAAAGDGVECVGYQILKGDATVFLSDGTSWSSKQGEVQKIFKRKVVVNGRDYPVRVGFHPDYKPLAAFRDDRLYDVKSSAVSPREILHQQRPSQ